MADKEHTNSKSIHEATPGTPRFYYGGQAVIEGVMIRGKRFMSVAARRPNGQLVSMVSPLSTLYTGILRRLPMIRGVIVLIETLMLGMKALMYSANVSIEEEEQELGRWSMALMLAVSLGFGVTVFFLLPLLVVQVFDRSVLSTPGLLSDILSNLAEGIIRLAFFLVYIWGIGLMPDVRRVFAYHGAEHMTVKAYEANEILDISHIRRFSTAHPRCGTAFLLVVMVVAIIVFVFLGRPPMLWRILSRIVLIPIIAGLAYEIIRFSAGHQNSWLVRIITAPSLLLQVLTTRQPADEQIEVAIHAMNTAIAADEGHQLPVDSKYASTENGPPSGAS